MENNIDVDVQVSPSLHPQVILSLPDYDDDTAPYLNMAVESFDVAYHALGKIHNARLQVEKSPTLTPDNRTLMVADFADKHQKAITRKFDSTVAAMSKSIDALDAQLNSPVASDAERLNISGEVRAFMRGMSTAERNNFLNQSLDKLDHSTLRAVLGAPAYLSGMTDDELKARTRMYHARSAPQIEKRLRVMRQVRDLMTSRSGLVFTQLEKAIGSDFGRVQEIRKAHNRATTALNFDSL